MYRSVALLALKNGVDLDNEASLVAMLAQHTIAIIIDPALAAGYRVLIDARDVGDRLFDPTSRPRCRRGGVSGRAF